MLFKNNNMNCVAYTCTFKTLGILFIFSHSVHFEMGKTAQQA